MQTALLVCILVRMAVILCIPKVKHMDYFVNLLLTYQNRKTTVFIDVFGVIAIK